MNAWAALSAAAVLAIVVASRPASAGGLLFAPDLPPEDEAPDQSPTWLETLEASFDPMTFISGTLPGDLADANLRAFLDTLAVAEGTAGIGDNGYNVRFGRKLFSSYADHPRIAVQFRDLAGRLLWTSAAGRYQFMAISPLPSGATTRVNTWDRLRDKLQLPDFSPASQDAAAIELIRERGALDDVRAGRFALAVDKCRRTWASLPASGHDQPEQPIERLAAAFTAAGGTITA